MNGTQGGAQKKGLSPLAWVGIGCGGLVVLAIIAITAGGIFVANKAADFVEDAEGNPAAAAAEMLVSLNPALELVESDREAGTITIRERSSGKVITVDLEQIEEGKISFEDENGETASFGASGEAVELPDWLPVYPGAVTAQGGFSSVAGGKRRGMFTFKTSAPPEDVLTHYEGVFNDLSLEVSTSSVTSGDQEVQNLTGKSSEYDINATVTDAAGDTGVAITYQGPE